MSATADQIRALSDYEYGFATVCPHQHGVPVPTAAPIGSLDEPADQPPVTVTLDEPLVELHGLAGGRVTAQDTYRIAGWPHTDHPVVARAGTAARLAEAALCLPDRFGLCVFDAWRPLELQRAIYDAAYTDPGLPAGFVSVPSTDPATPPPHLTGGTVDVTLTYGGEPLALGTGFDAFDDTAHTDAFEASDDLLVRQLRRLLVWTMRRQGFVVLDQEWWHFEYGTRRWAAITGDAPLYGAAATL